VRVGDVVVAGQALVGAERLACYGGERGFVDIGRANRYQLSYSDLDKLALLIGGLEGSGHELEEG
jgi:hypothetical protein